MLVYNGHEKWEGARREQGGLSALLRLFREDKKRNQAKMKNQNLHTYNLSITIPNPSSSSILLG